MTWSISVKNHSPWLYTLLLCREGFLTYVWWRWRRESLCGRSWCCSCCRCPTQRMLRPPPRWGFRRHRNRSYRDQLLVRMWAALGDNFSSLSSLGVGWQRRKEGGKAWAPPAGIVISSRHTGHLNKGEIKIDPWWILFLTWTANLWRMWQQF